MTFGQRLKFLREKSNLSQTGLGKILNVSQQTISQYENNQRTVPSEFIVDVANFFKVSSDYLLGIPESENKNLLILSVDDPQIRDSIESYAAYLTRQRINESHKKRE
ncbi:MAG: hypothetical protein AVO33_08905 [delta proteobacterium ML8_F1]|nr:MAG: hypothetical protein AVO33_08905 [delta proteobacterium ML8_F1]